VNTVELGALLQGLPFFTETYKHTDTVTVKN